VINFYRYAGPLLRMIDPETSHRLAITALKRGLLPAPKTVQADPMLKQELWGKTFVNPVGLAAGFDKNAEAVDSLAPWGFGFLEIGSVTPRPQPGNPRPRLFRLPAERAVINRMGFNNQGLSAVAGRLRARRGRGILGINLGMNKDSTDVIADYRKGVLGLSGLADYLVINVSSPNTPGLRALQGREPLRKLLEAVLAARAEAGEATGETRPTPPVLLKISPDLTEEDKVDIAAVALETGVDGMIATNTTIERPAELSDRHRNEQGGLSGRPLFEPSTRVLSTMYQLTEGKLPLIGVGGIASAADAYGKIKAGASLVQLYSALVYEGPGLPGRIVAGLPRLLKADGFDHISQAVGADHR